MGEYHGMFQGRALEGRDWVRSLPPEDRKVWASLGRMELSMRDVNWHALGGKVRAATASRRKGRFVSAAEVPAGLPAEKQASGGRPAQPPTESTGQEDISGF